MPQTCSSNLPDSVRFFDELPDSAQVRQPVLEALEGVSPTTIWRRVKAGLLPKPRKIGNTVSWNVGELRKARAKQAA